MKTKPQDLFDLSNEDDELLHTEPYGNQQITNGEEDDNEVISWVRDDMVGAAIDAPPQLHPIKQAPSINSTEDGNGSDFDSKEWME